MAKSAPSPPVSALTSAMVSVLAGSSTWLAPTCARQVALTGHGIEDDDLTGPGKFRCHHCAQADTPGAKDKDSGTRSDPRAVRYRAEAGRDRASNQSRNSQRHVGADRDAACLVDNDGLGERRQERVVVERHVA